MSIKVMSQVWESEDEWLRASRRLVLLALADNANDEGYCWPAIDTIAKKANLGRRYVMSILSELEEKKYLLRQQRAGTSTLYRVVNPASPLGGEPCLTPGVNPASLGGEPGFTGGVNPASPEPSFNHKEPSINHRAAAVVVSPVKVLTDASGLLSFPPKEVGWITPVQEMMHEYGVERTTAAMKAACTKWITTRGQNGQTYRKTNLNWIAWAQEELAATPPDYSGEVDMSKMNQAELDAYIKVKYADELEGA